MAAGLAYYLLISASPLLIIAVALKRHTPAEPEFGSMGPLLLAVRTLCLAIVYRGLPSRKIAWRDVWPSALFSVVLLGFGHRLIKAYLVFSGTGSAYTAAGSLIVLLFSFYFAAFVILLGAQFAKALCDHRQRATGLVQVETGG